MFRCQDWDHVYHLWAHQSIKDIWLLPTLQNYYHNIRLHSTNLSRKWSERLMNTVNQMPVLFLRNKQISSKKQTNQTQKNQTKPSNKQRNIWSVSGVNRIRYTLQANETYTTVATFGELWKGRNRWWKTVRGNVEEWKTLHIYTRQEHNRRDQHTHTHTPTHPSDG